MTLESDLWMLCGSLKKVESVICGSVVGREVEETYELVGAQT